MAAVLKLTDGNDELSLLDASNLYIQEWYQQIAPKLADGEYGDVEEQIKLAWMQTSDDSRDTTLQTLDRLAERADEYWRKRKMDGRVWIESRTHSETNSRYALLKAINPKKLDTRHWGPNRPINFETQFTREGAWRGVQPNTSPSAIVSATTIYNKNDSDGNNWVTINDTDAKGGPPGLVIFELDPGTDAPLPQNFIIAHAPTNTSLSEVNDFVTHFDAMMELDNNANRKTNTGAADDTMIEVTADTTLRWNLTSASRKLRNYAGEYLIYCVYHHSGAGSATMQFRHGNNYVAGPEVACSSVGSPGTAAYLGRTRIPGGIYNPTLLDNDYNLYLDIDITGVFTFRFLDLWVIPVTKSAPFVVRKADLSSGVLAVNGDYERTYEQTTGGLHQQTSSTAPETQGRYLTYEPGKYNRYHFFWTSNGELALPNYNMSVTVRIIPRFRALRGNL